MCDLLTNVGTEVVTLVKLPGSYIGTEAESSDPREIRLSTDKRKSYKQHMGLVRGLTIKCANSS